MALVIKNPPASAGDVRDLGLVPGLGRSPGEGNGNPLQYFCLENPMDRGTWWATVHGVTKGQTQLKWLSTHEYTKQTHRRRISSNGICRVRVGLSVQERSAEVLPGTPCGCRPNSRARLSPGRAGLSHMLPLWPVGCCCKNKWELRWAQWERFFIL